MRDYILNRVVPGTAAQWAASTTILPKGILCVETDTGISRLTDGVNAYSALTPLRDKTIATNGYFTTKKSLVPVAGNAVIDMEAGNVFVLESVADGGVVTGDITLQPPASIIGAGIVIIYAEQDVAGGHTLNFHPDYRLQQGSWDTTGGAINTIYLTFDGGSLIDATIAQRGEQI